MYNKDELSTKNDAELVGIARDLQIDASQFDKQEDLIYAILDKQAEVGSSKMQDATAKYKRSRIAKNDSNHVSQPKGQDDKSAEKSKPQTANPNNNQPSAEDIDKKIKSLETELDSLPRHRGPKTKQERLLITQINKLKEQQTALKNPAGQGESKGPKFFSALPNTTKTQQDNSDKNAFKP